MGERSNKEALGQLMNDIRIVDTDILIDADRGVEKARLFLENISSTAFTQKTGNWLGMASSGLLVN